MPVFKRRWQTAAPPLESPHLSNFSRVHFPIQQRDDDDPPDNYFRNQRVASSSIDGIPRGGEERLIGEIGYRLNDVSAEWGGLVYPISAEGEDYQNKQALELWVRVIGDDNATLHVAIGHFSEDTDGDERLDSEDLPPNLTDTNGDNVVDLLDMDLENLSDEDRFRGNGKLELDEDEGWLWNGPVSNIRIGTDNTILDTEDLNGDSSLDTLNAYFTIAIPLNAIPDEWMKKENAATGWKFLSIPLKEAEPVGFPNWGFVKQTRILVEKNGAGTAVGKLQFAAVDFVGNQWERGVVAGQDEKLRTDTGEYLRVSAKDNFNFDVYRAAYQQIEDNDEFRRLHPLVQSSYQLGVTERREQSLALEYALDPDSLGVTWRRVEGPRQGDGADLSKHQTLKIWVYNPAGRPTGATLVLRLSAALRSNNAYSYRSSGSPFDEKEEPAVNVFNELDDYYEFRMPIDFTGWKQAVVSIADENRDGQPDGLRAEGSPSLTSVGGVVLGILNETGEPMEGELWVNDIYLADPLVKSGWARRGDSQFRIGNLLQAQVSASSQDQDFEESAAQPAGSSYGRRYQQISQSANDFNMNVRLTLARWLPLEYSVRRQETETEESYNLIQTAQLGRNRVSNRTARGGVQFQKWPSLNLMVDSQEHWNESRGTELSDLYVATLRYDAARRYGLNAEYRHENVKVDRETADPNSDGGDFGYGYYGSSMNDRIIDSGSVSLQISPFESLRLQPSYDVTRQLNLIPGEDGAADRFGISERGQRVSLRPTINRSFFWGASEHRGADERAGELA